MKISTKARNAIFLGTLCSLSYFAVYIARNTLGAVTPKMTADAFSLDFIGELGAVYLLAYALGQLINGSIGDFIKAKYMIAFGLLSAGVSSLVFVQIASLPWVAMLAYAWTGFSLSMIYGPMTKLVSESTELIYATRCSLGYTFASFFGSPMAGVLATFLSWQAVFHVSSAVLIAMALVCFFFFHLFEKKGIVRNGAPQKAGKQPKKDYRALLRRSILKFSAIAVLTGGERTSLVSFLSTYFCDHLGYTEEETASIFSVTTFVICFTAFIAVFIYEKLGRSLHLPPLLFFAVSAIFFALTCVVSHPMWNIVLLVVAVMACNAAATILWSVYCPSLRDTGLVSGITGFLDFLSYASAALASLLIPRLVAAVEWQNLMLLTGALMLLGALICLPHFLQKRENVNS